MSIVIKTNQFNYKDPDTGRYVGLNAVAEAKVQDLIAMLEDKGEEVLDTIPSDYSALQEMVVEAYDPSKTYSVGDYVRHEDVLYRCIVDTSSDASFVAAHWQETVLANEVTDYSVDLTNKVQDLEDQTDAVYALEPYNIIPSGKWVIGGITQYGLDNDSVTNRIRTPYIEKPTNATFVMLSVSTGYKFVAYLYDSTKTMLSRITSWKYADYYLALASGVSYIRVVLGKSDDSDINTTEGINVFCRVESDITKEITILAQDKDDTDKLIPNSLLNKANIVNGGILNTGEDSNSDDTAQMRLRTGYIYIPSENEGSIISCTIASGYKAMCYIYNTSYNVIWKNTSFNTSDFKVAVPPGTTYVRFTMGRTDDGNITVPEASNFSAMMDTVLISSVRKLLKDQNYMQELQPISMDDSIVWVQGSINSSGKDATSNQRIRTNYLETPDTYDHLVAYAPDGYLYVWYFYNANLAYNGNRSNGWQTGTQSIQIPANTKYVRFAVRNSAGTNIDPSSGYVFSLNMYSQLITGIQELLEGSSGNANYYGRKIEINSIYNTARKYAFDVWKSIDRQDSSTMDGYTSAAYDRNQSIEAFDGKMFVLFNASSGNSARGVVIGCDPLDATKYKHVIGTIVGDTTLPSGLSIDVTRNHCNSAQFTDWYYDQNDDYPLLMVSMFGHNVNNDNTQPYVDDECLLFRIILTGSTYTLYLINTIKFDESMFGSSWGIDISANTITLMCYTNGVYTVTENNPMRFFTWRAPSEDEILSGEQIVLSRDTCISCSDADHGTLQAIHCLNGRVFTTSVIDGRQGVFWLDPATGEKLSVIEIPTTTPNLNEPEGLTIYNNKIYVTNRKGDSNEQYPMDIYEMSF